VRAKYIALIIAAFVFCAVSFAQEYTIRANRGLNLRAAPSRSAAIADTVRSGTILQVVGEFNRWLKIDRNGREVWLADWVDYSRVDSVEPTGPQPQQPTAPTAPTAPIDNCCYVDRQCHSDQEWLAGYWAYQNGQCPAPVQPQPATPAQPVVSAPANVDNCCLVDRHCQSDAEWLAGYWAYQNGQCAAPAQPQRVTSARPSASELATGGNCCNTIWDCWLEDERVQGYYAFQLNQCAGLPDFSAIALTGPVPRIEGSGRFAAQLTEALKLLKSIAPDWYNYVITGMDVIVEVPAPSPDVGYCTARAYARERRVTVESCWIDTLGPESTEINLLEWLGMLGHEACHIHTHADGRYFATLEDEEAECRVFGEGASILVASAFATGLSPRRGTAYFAINEGLSLFRRYCAGGYRADLFCPTLQRLESKWSNVPYAVFPPGAPEW